MIRETKLDFSLPDAQVIMGGHNKPFQLPVSARSEGLLFFRKPHLPIRQLTKLKIPMDMKIIIFELNLRKQKWLVVLVYKPPGKTATYSLNYLP